MNRALPSCRRVTRYVEEKAETIGESAVLEGRPLAVSSCGILSAKCSYPGDSAGGQRAFRGVATMVRGGGLLPITSAPLSPPRPLRQRKHEVLVASAHWLLEGCVAQTTANPSLRTATCCTPTYPARWRSYQ